jgi:hypothetical protein
VEETESKEPSVQRPPLRKVLVLLVDNGGWTAAIIALGKLTNDVVAAFVALLGYGGYLAWYFWSHRYH